MFRALMNKFVFIALLLFGLSAPGYAQYSAPTPLSITIEQHWAGEYPTVNFTLPIGATIEYEVKHTTTGGRDWLADYAIYSRPGGELIDYFSSFAPGRTLTESVKTASWTNNSSVTSFYMEAKIGGYFSSSSREIKSVLTAVGYVPNPLAPTTPILISATGTASGFPAYTWNAVSGALEYNLLVNDGTGDSRISQWFSAAEVGCANGTGTCSVTPETSVSGSVSWFVKARSGYGTSPASDGNTFDVPVAPPTQPTNANCNSGEWNSLQNFLCLITKVENAYPDKSPVQILDALRNLGTYDSIEFQVLLKDFPFFTGAGFDINPVSGQLTKSEIELLRDMLYHRFENGKELGVIIDPTDELVAAGHVLTGLSAGINYKQKINMLDAVTPPNTPLALNNPVSHVNNLLAVTLTGDLGQSAYYVYEGLSESGAYIGEGSEATYPELRGDIDGAILGNYVKDPGSFIEIAFNNGDKISEIIRLYYQLFEGRRYQLARSYLDTKYPEDDNILEDQTIRFADNYELIQYWKRKCDKPNLSLKAIAKDRFWDVKAAKKIATCFAKATFKDKVTIGTFATREYSKAAYAEFKSWLANQ